jgi:metacaspase-1
MRRAANIFILLLSCLNVSSQTTGAVKHALIFAIGNYPDSGGWPVISSLHDVSYIQNILSEQGFLQKNISVVSDKDATITGIKNAFEELTREVNKGDIVLIHFSSHGEQVEADYSNKTDGLDECVVTYNALVPSKSKDFSKDQAEYLRGHTLGTYLKKLRAKLGSKGDVVVFMDNCFSGDGARGVARIRGGGIPFVSNTFDAGRHRKSGSSSLYKESLSDENEKELASYEVISATMPDEVDYETMDEATNTTVGSLTYAISKAFGALQAGSALPTYRALFASIQTTMNIKAPRQHPLLEGNETDRIVFGGQFKNQMPFVEASGFDKTNNLLTIKQGRMAGLDSGAGISIYPAGTQDTSKAILLAKGEIIRSGNFSSVAILDRPIIIKSAAECWAFVTERTYNIEQVSIGVTTGKPGKPSTGYSAKETAQIKRYLTSLPYVKLTGTPEMIIIKGQNMDSLKINSNGYLFATVKNAITDSTSLRDKIDSYVRYKFLQNLHCQVKDVAVEIQLVPFVNGHPDTNSIQDRMINHTFLAYEKDTLTLRIKNTGRKDVYVNILDMQPDGAINPVLPNSSLAYPMYAHDLKIFAGQDFFLPAGDFIVVSPPFGTELFKIFASEKEIDLENIATSRGSPRPGEMTMIEKLISRSYSISRGAHTSSVGTADAATSELIFLIGPRPGK